MSHAPTPAERAATLTLLRLALILTGMAALYAVLTWQFLLPTLIARPRVTVGTLTNRSLIGAVQLGLSGLTLHALYIGGALLLWRGAHHRRLAELIWFGALGMALLLIWVYPVTSTDLFDYLFRGRMAVVYGENPYLALPNQLRNDPLFRYIGWPNAPSAYGPLWEDLSWLLTWLGDGRLSLSVLLYKLLATVAYLGCGAVIADYLDDPRARLIGVYLWLWSPLALWEFAAIGHNDALLVIALLLALWAAKRERYPLAVLALVAGALFKFLPAIFLPLVVLDWLRRQPTWAGRGRVLSVAALICLVPTVLLYAPYWDLPPHFGRLGAAEQLTAIWQGRVRTLHNVAVREDFLNASPLAVLSYQLQTSGALEQINRLAGLIGQDGITGGHVRGAVSALGSGLLALGLVWQCWQVWFRRRALQVACFGLLLWYILAGSQWFQPWYLLWPLGVFALRPTRSTFIVLAVWAMMAQASYLLQYFILPTIRLSGQTLEAQIYYLLLIYPLPLIVWLLSGDRRSPRAGPSRPLRRELASDR